MDVSIIIVNYYTSKLINDCVQSIFDNVHDIEYEIIIVDNNTEDLKTVIAKNNDFRVRLIQLDDNYGFGCANNEGAKIASGRNLLFLNPDTILLNDAVSILSNYLDNNNVCGICGGNLFDEELKPVHSFRRVFPSILWELIELSNYKLEKILYGKSSQFNHSQNPLDVSYITGADLMIKKELFGLCNGFSVDFFMYFEETDLCKRIKNLNYSIKSIPSAKIQHLEGRSYSQENRNKNFNPFRWTSIFESRIKYYKRHYSNFYTHIANILAYLTLWTKANIGSERNHQIFKIFKSVIKKH